MAIETNQDKTDWLRPAEVAAELGVSTKTVTRMDARGDLTPLRLPSGHRRYSRAEVEALAHPLNPSPEAA